MEKEFFSLKRFVEKEMKEFSEHQGRLWELLQQQNEELALLKQENDMYKALLVKMWSIEHNEQTLSDIPPSLESLHASLGEGVTSHTPNIRSADLSSQAILTQVTQRMDQMSADLASLKNQQTSLLGLYQDVVNENHRQDQELATLQTVQHTGGSVSAGSTYIRWGHDVCPSQAETVYSGVMGSSKYNTTGGAANHLCLTTSPAYDHHNIPQYGHTNIYGSEYATCWEPECKYTPTCAVCRTPRAASVMIPGTNVCAHGWTLEYSGYIMAGALEHKAATEYICVDSRRGYYGSHHHVDDDESYLYYTTFICGGLPCPPFADHAIVLCAVCSK